MRALALSLLALATLAQAMEPRIWTSREAVEKGSQELSTKLTPFLAALETTNASKSLRAQWKTVTQKNDALLALVQTGADYSEALKQFKQLEGAVGEARRLMFAEGLCYHEAVQLKYQAVRLSFRRLSRHIFGETTPSYSYE